MSWAARFFARVFKPRNMKIGPCSRCHREGIGYYVSDPSLALCYDCLVKFWEPR